MREPRAGDMEVSSYSSLEDLRKREGRAVTGATASFGMAAGLVKSLIDGSKLRSRCAVRYVAASHLVVQSFIMPSHPVESAEGATGIAEDTLAQLKGVDLTLRAFTSILPISQAALLSSSMEAELPGIFDKIFGAMIDKAILTGSGANDGPLGLFTASANGIPVARDVNLGAAGAPKLADLVSAASAVLASGASLDTAAIIMHPTILRQALADTTSGFAEFRLEALLRGTILGIPLILSSYCPTATVAGSYVCVAGDLATVVAGMAQEVRYDMINVVGHDRRYAQAHVYFNARPLHADAWVRLKTI